MQDISHGQLISISSHDPLSDWGSRRKPDNLKWFPFSCPTTTGKFIFLFKLHVICIWSLRDTRMKPCCVLIYRRYGQPSTNKGRVHRSDRKGTPELICKGVRFICRNDSLISPFPIIIAPVRPDLQELQTIHSTKTRIARFDANRHLKPLRTIIYFFPCQP